MLPVDQLFDGVTDIVYFLKNSRAQYLAVNDTLVQRCNATSKDAVIGKTVSELFPPPLSTEFGNQDEEILKSGIKINGHLELHLYPSGTQGWCLTYKQPIFSPAGEIIGICGISRDLPNFNRKEAELTKLSSALSHIRTQYHLPLRLPQIAAMAELSVYQFDQRIRALFQISAGQFIAKTRIDAACHKLAHSNQSLVEIALDCGYSDQSAFSRQFKQTVGLSPLAYRRTKRSLPTL